jgi:uncharacterized protein
MNTLQSNKDIAQALIAAINRGDRAGMLELLAPDVVWQVPRSAVAPYAGEHHGAAHVTEMMLGAVTHSFDANGVDHVPGLVIAEGEWVLVETRMTAAKPDGRRYDNDYAFVLRIVDGRIRVIREHVDTATAVQFFA